ncbi:MAG: hypothetical protein COT74_11320 [Bdellovibrionales bacterium CG10_big_fil_rev_8_21_14_0_10_45_34]|nr:MAG: hypothetical protein COT74_11320 [Bdellovibrionales bacterium CG10_big_fil_rev_8_21_14_0_10_45_34]
MRLQHYLIVTFPIFWLGVGKKYPFALLGESGPLIGIVFWSLVSLVWLLALFNILSNSRSQVKLENSSSKVFPVWLLLGGLAALVFDLIQWVQFRSIGYPVPWALFAVDILWITYASIGFKGKQVPPKKWLVPAIGYGVIHRALSILVLPLTAARSDMLPAIQQAIGRFWSGLPAYAPSTGGIGQMLYLPGTWMSYIPAEFGPLGISFDPRWIGLSYFIMLSLLIVYLQPRLKTTSIMLAVLWFTNPYLAFRHELYLDFFWLVLAVTTVIAQHRRPLLTGVMAGFSMLTLHWALILTPLWLLVATPKGNWKKLLASALIAVTIFCFGIGAFLNREGSYLVEGILMPMKWIREGYRGELCLGLPPLFYKLGLKDFLQPLQLIMLFTIGLYTLIQWLPKKPKFLSSWSREGSQFGPGPAVIPLALTLFIFLNPFLENYFYLAPLLLFSLIIENPDL